MNKNIITPILNKLQKSEFCNFLLYLLLYSSQYNFISIFDEIRYCLFQLRDSLHIYIFFRERKQNNYKTRDVIRKHHASINNISRDICDLI